MQTYPNIDTSDCGIYYYHDNHITCLYLSSLYVYAVFSQDNGLAAKISIYKCIYKLVNAAFHNPPSFLSPPNTNSGCGTVMWRKNQNVDATAMRLQVDVVTLHVNWWPIAFEGPWSNNRCIYITHISSHMHMQGYISYSADSTVKRSISSLSMGC